MDKVGLEAYWITTVKFMPNNFTVKQTNIHACYVCLSLYFLEYSSYSKLDNEKDSHIRS